MKLNRAASSSLKTLKSAVWKSGRQIRLASHSAARELTSRAQGETEEGEEGQHGKASLPTQGIPSLPKGWDIDMPSHKQVPSHGGGQPIPSSRAARHPQETAWAKRQAKKHTVAQKTHAGAGQDPAQKAHAEAGQGRWQAATEQNAITARREALKAAKKTMPPPGSPMASFQASQAARQETAKTPMVSMAAKRNIPAGWGAATAKGHPRKDNRHIPPGWETAENRSAASQSHGMGPSHKTTAPCHGASRSFFQPPQAGAMAGGRGRGATLTSHGATISSQGITLTSHGARQAAKGTASTAGMALGATTAGTTAAAAAISNLAEATAQMARRGQEKIQEAMAATMAGKETGQKKSPDAGGRNRPHGSGFPAFFGMAAMAFFLPICMLLMLPATAGTSGSAIPRNPGGGGTIVEVAQEEAVGVHRGGAKYKEWYGMDDNWCAMFVSWCADQCGYLEQGIMPKTASVSSMQSWYMEKNLYQTKESGYEPVAGDIVIFKNGRSHVGIVTAYDASTETITTIEGNTGSSGEAPYHSGSQVKEREYLLSEGTISGYGTPLYPPTAGQDAAEADGITEGTDGGAEGTDGTGGGTGGNAEGTGNTAQGTDGTAMEAEGAIGQEEEESADQNQ